MRNYSCYSTWTSSFQFSSSCYRWRTWYINLQQEHAVSVPCISKVQLIVINSYGIIINKCWKWSRSRRRGRLSEIERWAYRSATSRINWEYGSLIIDNNYFRIDCVLDHISDGRWTKCRWVEFICSLIIIVRSNS